MHPAHADLSPLHISMIGVGRADRGVGPGPAWGRRRAIALVLGGEHLGEPRIFAVLLAIESGGVAPGLGARAAAAAGLAGVATLTFASGAPGGPALDGGMGLDAVAAEAVEAALADLQPGTLVAGRALRWDVLRCTDPARVLRRRKLERPAAHLRTAEPDAGLKRLIEELHADPAPPSVIWEAALCDPALSVLCARDAAGRPRLTLAWVGGREAGLPGPPREGGGVYGRASRLLEAQLWARHRHATHAMLLCGAGGDARLELDEAPAHDLLRGAERAARRLSDALSRAVAEALNGPPLGLDALVVEQHEGADPDPSALGVSGIRLVTPTTEVMPLLCAPHPATPLLLAGLRRAGLRPLAVGAARVRGVDPLPDGLKATLDLADRLRLTSIPTCAAPAPTATDARTDAEGPAETWADQGGAVDHHLPDGFDEADTDGCGEAADDLLSPADPAGGIDGPAPLPAIEAGEGQAVDAEAGGEDGPGEPSDPDSAPPSLLGPPAESPPARKPRKPRPEPEPPPPPGAPTLQARIRGEGAEARAVLEGDAALSPALGARGQAGLRIELGTRIPEPKHPGGAKPKRPRPPRYTWAPLFWGGTPVDDLHQTLRTGPAGDRWRWRFEAPLPPRWRGMAFRVVVDGVASAPDVLR